MGVSQAIAEQMERSSWIRRMFEIGLELRRTRGAENVFDFSLGNPEVEPPAAVLEALRRVVAEERPHSHGYMPNAGFADVRAALAADPMAYGVKATRKVLETIAAYLHAQGLTDRVVKIEELFAPATWDL